MREPDFAVILQTFVFALILAAAIILALNGYGAAGVVAIIYAALFASLMLAQKRTLKKQVAKLRRLIRDKLITNPRSRSDAAKEEESADDT